MRYLLTLVVLTAGCATLAPAYTHDLSPDQRVVHPGDNVNPGYTLAAWNSPKVHYSILGSGITVTGPASVLMPGATGTDLTLTGPLAGFQYLAQGGTNTDTFGGPISDTWGTFPSFTSATGYAATATASYEFVCSLGSGTCNLGATVSGVGVDLDANAANITIGVTTGNTVTIGRSGQNLVLPGREFVIDKVSSGISAGSLLATGTNYSGYKLPQAWTATHMSINVTTASTATVANTVFTLTDGTNTCTATYACNTTTNTTGVKDVATANGAGTGCVYAAAALVTMSVTTQGCATAATVNSITTWGKPQ